MGGGGQKLEENAIKPYAAAHDAAVWGTLQACVGEPAEDAECPARAIALLPASLGGLGLTQATRAAPAAYWAAWADSLAVFEARCPRFAAWAVAALQDGTGPACLRAAEAGRQLLLNEGWVDVPTWSRVARGARPPGPEPDATEPGGRVHGWQFHASRTRNRFFRDRVLLPSLSPAHRALVRSQAGPHAGAWLAAIPSDPHTTLSPEMMQIALRRRLRLPLPLAAGRCGGQHGGQSTPGCGRLVDEHGDHALACPRTGLLARRAKVVERAWVRVAREAVGPEGQVVPQQWLAHTTAPGVPPGDRRRLDLVIYGATPLGGALCCDATLVSPLARDGTPHCGAADRDGAVLRTAERRKRATYPELAQGGAQQLCVLGCEVGGRWNAEAASVVRRLVRLRACRAPAPLRAAAGVAWARRWWSALSVACQQAVGSTALGRARAVVGPAQDSLPTLAAVLALGDPDGPSRLPLR